MQDDTHDLVGGAASYSEKIVIRLAPVPKLRSESNPEAVWRTTALLTSEVHGCDPERQARDGIFRQHR